jgi:hypothetical protein
VFLFATKHLNIHISIFGDREHQGTQHCTVFTKNKNVQHSCVLKPRNLCIFHRLIVNSSDIGGRSQTAAPHLLDMVERAARIAGASSSGSSSSLSSSPSGPSYGFGSLGGGNNNNGSPNNNSNSSGHSNGYLFLILYHTDFSIFEKHSAIS